MAYPIAPPVKPMLAKLQRDIPAGDGWLYEPKWDGFRAIVFRDGDDLRVDSRNGQPLLRYFPEMHDIARAWIEKLYRNPCSGLWRLPAATAYSDAASIRHLRKRLYPTWKKRGLRGPVGGRPGGLRGWPLGAPRGCAAHAAQHDRPLSHYQNLSVARLKMSSTTTPPGGGLSYGRSHHPSG